MPACDFILAALAGHCQFDERRGKSSVIMFCNLLAALAGHCQFDAVAHQIARRFPTQYGPRAANITWKNVREDVAEWLRKSAVRGPPLGLGAVSPRILGLVERTWYKNSQSGPN
jgi:hypothetical protein